MIGWLQVLATGRFDIRRGLVLTESNSIGTTYLHVGYPHAGYLHAGYLQEAASRDSRALLREHESLRVAPKDVLDIRVRTAEVLDQL